MVDSCSAQIKNTSNGFAVCGALGFDNVLHVYKGGERIIRSLPTNTVCTIDLSQMQEQNAAAITLMLSWMRVAKKSNTNICFTQLSDSLRRMLETFEVMQVLPLQ